MGAVLLQAVVNAPLGTSVTFYGTGTLIKQNIYEDDTLDPMHELANPQVIGSSGYPPPIYLDGSLKYRMQVLLPGESVAILDVDPVNEFVTIEGSDLAVGAVIENLGYTPANKAGDTFTGNTGANFTPTVINNNDFGFALRAPNIKDADYHIGLGDNGRTMMHDDTSTPVWTIDPHSVTPYPPGFWFRIRNVNTGVPALTRGAGVTLRLSGSATSQDVSCAEWCDLVVTCDAQDIWNAEGTGGS